MISALKVAKNGSKISGVIQKCGNVELLLVALLLRFLPPVDLKSSPEILCPPNRSFKSSECPRRGVTDWQAETVELHMGGSIGLTGDWMRVEQTLLESQMHKIISFVSAHFGKLNITNVYNREICKLTLK